MKLPCGSCLGTQVRLGRVTSAMTGEKASRDERVVGDAAQAVVRRVSRFLMFDDGEQVNGFWYRSESASATWQKAGCEMRVCGRGLFESRFNVELHHLSPGAPHPFVRLRHEISPSHGTVQQRLNHGRFFAVERFELVPGPPCPSYRFPRRDLGCPRHRPLKSIRSGNPNAAS
jgi:hypothetical protein